MPEKAGKGKEKQLIDLNALEEKWQKYWAEQGINKFNPDSRKPVYSIDTPPPYVSGEIHVGHAMHYSQFEFIARYKRMQGYEVFYPFGFDDNGLPTERYVEKKYNVKAKDVGRTKFIELCLKETELGRKEYKEIFSRLGHSPDWSLTYSTINPYCQKQSQRSFIELYRKNRIYRKKEPIIWCPSCLTAVAQSELEDKELESTLNDIYFTLEKGDKIIISTSRPELLSSCVAIAVNPNDARHAGLIGQKAIVPLFNYKVKVIADEKVAIEFGSGIVMICTFGDKTDIEWWRKHRLDLKISLNKDATLNEFGGKFKGMHIKEARKAIIEELKKEGILKTQKSLKHAVNVHDRCETAVEFLPTEQWFVRVLDLKKELIEAGDKIKWFPKHMKTRYNHWVAGLQWDWVISRQRHYGVPFPVWYCKKCNEVYLPFDEDLPVDPLKDKCRGTCSCGSNEFEPERDVMDTWMTSSLTPQIACRWKEDKEFFNKLVPMSLRPQAHDIIRTWAFYTIVKALLHNDEIPWKDIMISGHGLSSTGERFSKSKGNVIKPLDVVSKYSADCLRYMAGSAILGEDITFQEKEVMTGKKFIVKLWNAAKFVEKALEGFDVRRIDESKLKFTPADKWILSRLNSLILKATESLDVYEFSKALKPARDFFWLEFCDYYLEEIKYRLYNEKKFGLESKQACQYVLRAVLFDLIKLLAPFMPHITEEIYQKMFRNHLALPSIHLSSWPKANEKLISEHYEELGKHFNDVTSAIRQFKQKNKLPLNAELKEIILFVDNDELVGMFEEASEDLREANHVISMDVLIAEAPEKAVQVNSGIKAVISM